VVFIGIPAVSAKFLPVWGVLLVVVGEAAVLIVGGPRLIKYGVKRFLLGMFQTKSRVLRGAGVHVHRVEATVKPDEREPPATLLPEASPDGEAEPDDQQEPDHDNYVLVDFTLSPRPGQSRMQHYEPSELMLVPFDYKVKIDEDPTSSTDAANCYQIRLIDESGGETEDFSKITGPAHLRAVFACPPTLRGRVKFQYYFETFGDLLLP